MWASLRRLLHWGPICVLGIIKLVTWSMVHLIGMWWPPQGSLGGALHAALFLFLAGGTLYYFLQSLLEGPGFVPLKWRPRKEEDTEHLQFCTICNGYKAPRSHHCRKCGHCVMKMDHHCPWINCCVGHANHCYFTYFLIFAVLGCLQAAIVLSICMYHAINRAWYVQSGVRAPRVLLTLPTLLLTLLAVGMCLGVVLAVGALLGLQIRSILRNRTTIEDWILEKAVSRREEAGLPPFQFPYDLGWRENLKFVLHGHRYDGLSWPVRPGCHEFDLTREQRAQKEDKRLRSRLYTATAPYSGRWLPLRGWPRAALAPPCTDEPRLPLAPGDVVRATRQRKQWLFGERLVGAGEARGPRGWFPRDAATPTDCKLKPD
ncbi:palmitoyltransferase ZDHHC6 [Choristoneura fumiferana]|uniref:palmitoyltransferase ZDHHC6 n=1 Tax=Choristoneura fumiferana TaxID=7141 RepID=UPI003D155591